MKKMSRTCMICCLLLSFIFHSISVAASQSELPGTSQPVNEASTVTTINSCHGLDATTALLGTGQIVDNAKAAILYEANSKTLMHAWNQDEQLYPASLVKILTALLAVEKGNLSDVVTVSESAVSEVPYDAVSADLQPGEQITMEDLLHCLLVGSANDAAIVIAEHISGSHSTFVQEMNLYAQALGCTGSQFTNAHGLHNESQYTTARDVARILDAALTHDAFKNVFTAVSYTVNATNKSQERFLESSNSLRDTSSRLYYDSRVIGGRTGVTEDGRRCLAAAAQNGDMLLISVVLGSESVYQEDGYSAISVGGYKETTALLDAGFNGYKSAQILFANQALKQYAVANGDCDVVAGPQISVATVLPAEVLSSDMSFRYAEVELSAPIEAGEKISSVEIWHGAMCVAQADLYAMNSVRLVSMEPAEQDEQADRSGWSQAMLVLLGVIAGIVLVLVILRFTNRIRRMAAKNKSKRYSRNRRRSR